MPLLNIFKKKELKIKPSSAKTTKDKKEKKIEEKPIEPIKPVEVKISKEKKIDLAWQILKTPHITEKATDLAEKNQYVFNVYPRTNKIEVKKAVKDIYGADVVSVKIINVPRKKRRLGKTQGWKEGYKKAIVKIKEGQKIEVMPR